MQSFSSSLKSVHRTWTMGALFLFLAVSAHADVKLPRLFSDHMVLQRDVPAPIWGWADPGETVSVTLAGQEKTVTADASGKWTVQIDPLKVGDPLTLTVKGKNTLTLSDILVGEVWLCSGQSNMDMRVAKGSRYWCGVDNEAEEVAQARFPKIRQYYVVLNMKDEAQTDTEGAWIPCSPETVGEFSATAYFTGRELHQKLGVPIGLLVTTYGASTAEAWASRSALEKRPELKDLLDAYAAKCQTYDKARLEAGDQPPTTTDPKTSRKRPLKDPHQDQHNPSVLYNGMIAPLIPYAIRGALWYQGESNGPTADRYFMLMETLIQDWRARWGQGDFPFLYVQLANNEKPQTDPNNRSATARVREGQLQTLRLPKTGMAVTLDIGDAANVHPKNKQEVGRRLGLVARTLVYGEKIPCSGPLYDSMVVEGNVVRVKFKEVNGGLVARGDKLTGFVLAGEDQKFIWADAKIDGDSVVVSSPEVAKPVAVRYGWANNPAANLYNRADLPASPFRTDTW